MSDDDTTQKFGVNVEPLGGGLEKAEDSQQLDDRRIATDRGLGIKPPYNADYLAAFFELNETHAASVRKKARYEVGHGFNIETHREVDEGDEDQLEDVKEFWHGIDSKWQIGPHGTAAATPNEVLEQARIDYHAIGYCALEILTSPDGTPTGLAHIPAREVRVRKEKTDDDNVIIRGHGYVQVKRGRTKYFGEAGDRYGDDQKFVDKETGEVESDSRDLPNGPANELIWIINPSPLSLYYGVPDWISATRTIAADESAKDYNHDFFSHDTVPRYAIKVTGGELKEESKEELRGMFSDLEGSSHRTVLLEVEKFSKSFNQEIDIELQPISAGRSKDMEFEAFRNRNEHEIAKVHEVPPILLNRTETSNRSNSDAQRQEFALDIIAPEQQKFAERLYQVLHQTALDAPDWTIKFDLRGADRPKKEAEIARSRVAGSRGTMTVNEARDEFGLSPVPEDSPIDGDTLLANLDDDPIQQAAEGRPEYLPPEENQVGSRSIPLTLANKDGIETMSFSSSNLDQGLYDSEDEELYISFSGDSMYVYLDVPESEWQGLSSASSHGSYHHDNIRLDYMYEEITDNHSPIPEGDQPDSEDLPEGL